MSKPRAFIALALCVTGGLLALVLLSKHYGVPLLGEAALAACGEGGGCDAVAQSRYSHIGDVPLAAIGLFFYGALLTLLAPMLFSTREEPEGAPSLAFALTALALLIDLALFGVQAGAIKAFCKFCIATYFVNAALLATLWPWRSPAGAFAFPMRETRAFASWTAAALAVLAMALSLNSGLIARKELAGASILGAPFQAAPSAVSAVPPVPGSLEEQLAAARAEAKKWKDTLDNDQRLQSYLNDRARLEFNETATAKIDLTRAPSQGPADAPIVVASFSDFMCPFCRELAIGLHNYLPRIGGQVRSIYKQFPLDQSCNPGIGRTVHEGACEFSLASICADDVGRFWDFHDKVFARTWEKVTRDEVIAVGVSAGLDGARLRACMTSATTKGRLARDIDEGSRLDVSSTPTVFVNGKKLKSMGVFLLAVEEEKKRLNLNAPPPAAAARKR